MLLLPPSPTLKARVSFFGYPYPHYPHLAEPRTLEIEGHNAGQVRSASQPRTRVAIVVSYINIQDSVADAARNRKARVRAARGVR